MKRVVRNAGPSLFVAGRSPYTKTTTRIAAQKFRGVFDRPCSNAGALGYENRGPRLDESAAPAIAESSANVD
jgi:hypothetical protein